MSIRGKIQSKIESHLNRGRRHEAIIEYRRLLMASPDEARSRQKLAELLFSEKRFEEAVVEYAVVAQKYVDTGFYLKGIATYLLMQKCEPDNPAHYIPLIELFEKQGLIGNALATCEKLLKFYDELGDEGKVQEAKELLAQKTLEYDATFPLRDASDSSTEEFRFDDELDFE